MAARKMKLLIFILVPFCVRTIMRNIWYLTRCPIFAERKLPVSGRKWKHEAEEHMGNIGDVQFCSLGYPMPSKAGMECICGMAHPPSRHTCKLLRTHVRHGEEEYS